MNNENSKHGLIAVMLVVGLIVGMVIAYPIGKSMSDDSNDKKNASSMSVNKPGELQIGLDGLLREHVSSSMTVTRNIVDGVSEAKLQGSKDAQTANAVAIAETVGSVYGDDAQTAITAPFVSHIGNSNKYAEAVMAGDTQAEAAALTALQADLRKVADVFSSVIPSLSSDTLYEALNQHEGLLNDSIKEYKAGNFQKAYELENQALVQISGGAKALSGGIVASKPDMFK
jgi:hypothetical protein